MAKRQREAEKRDKAILKREKREKKQPSPTVLQASVDVSDDEFQVLNLFRKYLMNAGEMLCINASDMQTHSMGLRKLVETGMLLEEGTRGGYSLTSEGFHLMRAI